jgi:hypothetical protein
MLAGFPLTNGVLREGYATVAVLEMIPRLPGGTQ